MFIVKVILHSLNYGIIFCYVGLFIQWHWLSTLTSNTVSSLNMRFTYNNMHTNAFIVWYPNKNNICRTTFERKQQCIYYNVLENLSHTLPLNAIYLFYRYGSTATSSMLNWKGTLYITLWTYQLFIRKPCFEYFTYELLGNSHL